LEIHVGNPMSVFNHSEQTYMYIISNSLLPCRCMCSVSEYAHWWWMCVLSGAFKGGSNNWGIWWGNHILHHTTSWILSLDTSTRGVWRLFTFVPPIQAVPWSTGETSQGRNRSRNVISDHKQLKIYMNIQNDNPHCFAK